MRDHQDGHPQFILEIVHQLQDLGLDGHIQRRRRFVGDQQGRAADQCHRDDRALPEPTRKFERVCLHRLGFGLGKPTRPSISSGHFVGQLLALASVKPECF